MSDNSGAVVIYEHSLELIVGDSLDGTGELFSASGKRLDPQECEWPPFDDEQEPLTQEQALQMLFERGMTVKEAGVIITESTPAERNAALGAVSFDTAIDEGDVDAILVAIATFALACRAAGLNGTEG